MRISAKADYAVRACVELAVAEGQGPVKRDAIATAQDIPGKFLEAILADLRQSQLVRSYRGPDGGWELAKPAAEITLADVVRAVEGPLASVRGGPPEEASFPGVAEPLQRVWIAVRANLRAVVEGVTLADLAAGKVPPAIDALADDPQAWLTR